VCCKYFPPGRSTKKRGDWGKRASLGGRKEGRRDWKKFLTRSLSRGRLEKLEKGGDEQGRQVEGRNLVKPKQGSAIRADFLANLPKDKGEPRKL